MNISAPHIAYVASLMGNPVRASVLMALMDGRALTASELANATGVTKQTMSGHLAKLIDGKLIQNRIQGRHHYFSLMDEDTATAIESLMCLAENRSNKTIWTGPKDKSLRKARVCYNHLAGEMGVYLFDKLVEHDFISKANQEQDQAFAITEKGHHFFGQFGITPTQINTKNSVMCKGCLDWSNRRYHLAGKLGTFILTEILNLGWAKRRPDTRIVEFNHQGEAAFYNWLKNSA